MQVYLNYYYDSNDKQDRVIKSCDLVTLESDFRLWLEQNQRDYLPSAIRSCLDFLRLIKCTSFYSIMTKKSEQLNKYYPANAFIHLLQDFYFKSPSHFAIIPVSFTLYFDANSNLHNCERVIIPICLRVPDDYFLRKAYVDRVSSTRTPVKLLD